MEATDYGELLQELRRVRGWTQEATAELFGTRAQTVSNWERGVYNMGGPAIQLLKRLVTEAGLRWPAIG